MKNMKKANESSRKRLLFLLGATFLLSFALIVRIGYLQVAEDGKLKKKALNQWTKTENTKPNRGILYDRNGKKLAIAKTVSTVWINPNEVKPEKKETVILELASLLPGQEDKISRIVHKEKGAEKAADGIDKKIGDEIRELRLPGVTVDDENRRYYPYGNFAAHILGFTNSENVGLYGIENTYNEYLIGTRGKSVKIKDRYGRKLPFDEDKVYDPLNGLSAILTVDETIQQFAEKAVSKSIAENNAKNISVIAMDPNTGEILAMVSKPDYNPNSPREARNEAEAKRWASLSQEDLTNEMFASWRNYAINDIYEPGSTFKLITAAATIEENKANPNTWFRCTGGIRDIKGVSLKCYSTHGDIDLKTGLAKSCNVVSVHSGRMLGKENLLKYVRAFGFGDLTGIDLNGEEYGLIPNSLAEMTDVRLATVSYGHGIAVTPIQLVTAVSAVVNGGDLLIPRTVKELIDDNGNTIVKFEKEIKRKVISKKTSETMRGMMEGVVDGGTGRNAYIPGYKIGGKTGTAEKIVGGSYAPGKYIGSFIGVAPLDDPKIVLLVVVDDPEGLYNGGLVAAPIGKEILEQTLPYLEVPRELEEDRSKGEELILVPDVTNKSIAEAGPILYNLGLKHTTDYSNLSDNSIILGQNPLPGTYVEKSSIIDLYLNKNKEENLVKETNIMPDLMGKTKEEVVVLLDQLGLTYELRGEGKVIYQYPVVGEKISVDSIIEVELK